MIVTRTARLFAMILGLSALAARLIEASPPAEVPSEDLTPLRTMIAFQKDLRTLCADYTQTRSLRTLRHPLISQGRFFYEAPSRFRWETDTPAKSILIGNPSGLYLITPDGNRSGIRKLPAGKGDEMAFLSLSEGDFESFRRTFRILSLTTTASSCGAVMQPLVGDAARGVQEIELTFNGTTGAWISLRIVTRDGSSLLYEFSNIRINKKLPEELFGTDPMTPPGPGREKT